MIEKSREFSQEATATAGVSIKGVTSSLGLKIKYSTKTSVTYTLKPDSKKAKNNKYYRAVAYIDAKMYGIKMTKYFLQVIVTYNKYGKPFITYKYWNTTSNVKLFIPVINSYYILLEYS